MTATFGVCYSPTWKTHRSFIECLCGDISLSSLYISSLQFHRGSHPHPPRSRIPFRAPAHRSGSSPLGHISVASAIPLARPCECRGYHLMVVSGAGSEWRQHQPYPASLIILRLSVIPTFAPAPSPLSGYEVRQIFQKRRARRDDMPPRVASESGERDMHHSGIPNPGGVAALGAMLCTPDGSKNPMGSVRTMAATQMSGQRHSDNSGRTASATSRVPMCATAAMCRILSTVHSAHP